MNTSNPLVTIIVAVFNAEQTLQQCLDSVANQTYKNTQLVVIDGGSNDKTVEILEKNKQKIDYYVSEPDRGIYHAWNKGLTKARGEWICFLGSDDYFYNNEALQNMQSGIVHAASSDIKVVYGKVMLVNSLGLEQGLIGEDWRLIKDKFKALMCIPHPAVLHHKTLFEQYGNFDEQFRIAGDYEILLRLLKQSDAYSLMDVTMVAMREGGISSNPDNALRSLKEMRLAQKKHGQTIINKTILVLMLKTYARAMIVALLGHQFANKTFDTIRALKKT